MRIRNHIRSNIIGYVALFFAFTASAVALPGVNTVFSDDIVNGEVKSADLSTDSVNGNKLRDNSTGSLHVIDNSLRTQDILDENLTGADLGPDSVGNSELATDAAGSDEIIDESLGNSDLGTDSVGAWRSSTTPSAAPRSPPGIVGADELESVHEHTGPATDVTDPTEHDGSYTLSSATVACGTGEDLLSVSVDWTATGGHNERMTVGVQSINRAVDPETASVQVAYDGGATTATWTPVATCIF